MVPGSTLRYGSSFFIVTRRPRSLSRRPRLEAVRPLPRLEATPPVTNTCLVRTGRGVSADVAKLAPVVVPTVAARRSTGSQNIRNGPVLTCTDTESHEPGTGRLPEAPC